MPFSLSRPVGAHRPVSRLRLETRRHQQKNDVREEPPTQPVSREDTWWAAAATPDSVHRCLRALRAHSNGPPSLLYERASIQQVPAVHDDSCDGCLVTHRRLPCATAKQAPCIRHHPKCIDALQCCSIQSWPLYLQVRMPVAIGVYVDLCYVWMRECIVHGAWRMVHGAWRMVHGA